VEHLLFNIVVGYTTAWFDNKNISGNQQRNVDQSDIHQELMNVSDIVQWKIDLFLQNLHMSLLN